MFFLGLLIVACGMWAAAHFAGPGFVHHEQVHILEDPATTVDADGTAIAFDGSGRTGVGYTVAGARWKQDGRPWNDSSPTCLAPGSSGQRVTLGVVEVPPVADALGGPAVVWLVCHGAPTSTG